MKKDDTCYYMSITKEENSAFVVHANQQNQAETQTKEGKKFASNFRSSSTSVVLRDDKNVPLSLSNTHTQFSRLSIYLSSIHFVYFSLLMVLHCIEAEFN